MLSLAQSAELWSLRERLTARRGRSGYRANVVAIEKRIAELEALDAAAPPVQGETEPRKV